MNKYRFEGDKCFIEINSKKFGRHEVIIDTEDWPRVRMFTWVLSRNKKRLVVSAAIRKPFNVLIHRLATSFAFEIVDHADGNTLNNCKANLREATAQQNNANQRRNKKRSLPPGIRAHGRKFLAEIRVRKKRHYLGLFGTVNEAFAAYREKSIVENGEFSPYFNQGDGLR